MKDISFRRGRGLCPVYLLLGMAAAAQTKANTINPLMFRSGYLRKTTDARSMSGYLYGSHIRSSGRDNTFIR